MAGDKGSMIHCFKLLITCILCILCTKFTIIGVFQGLAITLVSDEGDAKILNEVQDRFDVNITELPDEIDLSSYSKLIGMDILSYTLPDLCSRTYW